MTATLSATSLTSDPKKKERKKNERFEIIDRLGRFPFEKINSTSRFNDKKEFAVQTHNHTALN